MPNKKKKTKANAFSMYMIDLKCQLEEKGQRFPNGLSDVVSIAGPKFKEISEEDRLYYEQLAKERNARDKNDITQKYTSQGVPLSVVRQEEEDEAQAHLNMLREIENTVRNLDKETTLRETSFYFIHVNYYCYVVETRDFIPCEIALSEFNLQQGIVKTYHEIINPGVLPTGYRYEARKHADDTHRIDYPPEAIDLVNYSRTVNHIKDFIGMGHNRKCPPLYTLPAMKQYVARSLEYMCFYAGEPADMFRVYDITRLFYEIRNKAAEGKGGGFPVYSLAEEEMSNDIFNYTLGIGCKYHEEEKSEAIQHCSLSIVRRWGFLIADYTCQDLNINLIPGQHCPRTSDTMGRLDCGLDDEDEQSHASNEPDVPWKQVASSKQKSRPEPPKSRGKSVAASLASSLMSADPKSQPQNKPTLRIPQSPAIVSGLVAARSAATNRPDQTGSTQRPQSWSQAVGRGTSVAYAVPSDFPTPPGRGQVRPTFFPDQTGGRARGLLAQVKNLNLQ